MEESLDCSGHGLKSPGLGQAPWQLAESRDHLVFCWTQAYQGGGG